MISWITSASHRAGARSISSGDRFCRIDDHLVIEAAMAGSAEYIITFNKKDFQPAESFGITLMTPKEFLLHLSI